MSFHQPPVHARNFGRPPDDLDGLLRDFLRWEMPDPWPALAVPELPPLKPVVGPTPRRWGLFNSRLALAATLAFCLVGTGALSSLLPGDSSPKGQNNTVLDDNTTADKTFRETIKTKTELGVPVKVDGEFRMKNDKWRKAKIVVDVDPMDPGPMED
jgi:hypothetical protein